MAPPLNDALIQLKDRSADVRRAAAEALARLEHAAQPAAVPLIDACGDEDDVVREWAAAALEGVGAPAPSDCDRLAQRVGAANPGIAWWAATLLGRLGSEAQPAVAPLTAALESHPASEVRQRAAWALGKIGRPARAAIPALRASTNGADARLVRLAQQALDAIETDA